MQETAIIQTGIPHIIWCFVLIGVLSYLTGNINFALIISRLKKSDVRNMGSGNPGTLNMSRNFGLKIGLLTLVLDMIKGGLPSLISYLIMRKYHIGAYSMGDLARFFSGICVIIGHIFPIFLRFKGGKGIASTLGVFVFSRPGISAIILAATLLYIYLTEWGSMGSLIAVSGLAVMQLFIFFHKYPVSAGAYTSVLYAMILGICFLTWFAHRKNILKLLAGEEHHTSVRKLAGKKNKH